MKQSSKGFNVKVEEPDIGYAFRMSNRVEKYGLGLDQIDAHTFRIMEIIEEEKDNVKTDKMQRLKQDLKNG